MRGVAEKSAATTCTKGGPSLAHYTQHSGRSQTRHVGTDGSLTGAPTALAGPTCRESSGTRLDRRPASAYQTGLGEPGAILEGRTRPPAPASSFATVPPPGPMPITISSCALLTAMSCSLAYGWRRLPRRSALSDRVWLAGGGVQDCRNRTTLAFSSHVLFECAALAMPSWHGARNHNVLTVSLNRRARPARQPARNVIGSAKRVTGHVQHVRLDTLAHSVVVYGAPWRASCHAARAYTRQGAMT